MDETNSDSDLKDFSKEQIGDKWQTPKESSGLFNKIFAVLVTLVSLTFLFYSFTHYISYFNPKNISVANAENLQSGSTIYKISDGNLLCDKKFTIIYKISGRYGESDEENVFAPMVSGNKVIFVDFVNDLGVKKCEDAKTITGTVQYIDVSKTPGPGNQNKNFLDKLNSYEASSFKDLRISPYPNFANYFRFEDNSSLVWPIFFAVVFVLFGFWLIFLTFRKR